MTKNHAWYKVRFLFIAPAIYDTHDYIENIWKSQQKIFEVFDSTMLKNNSLKRNFNRRAQFHRQVLVYNYMTNVLTGSLLQIEFLKIRTKRTWNLVLKNSIFSYKGRKWNFCKYVILPPSEAEINTFFIIFFHSKF